MTERFRAADIFSIHFRFEFLKAILPPQKQFQKCMAATFGSLQLF
jgi:hypothetical protein